MASFFFEKLILVWCLACKWADHILRNKNGHKEVYYKKGRSMKPQCKMGVICLEHILSLSIRDTTTPENFVLNHARIQTVFSEWVQLWKLFFLFDEGIEDQNNTKSDPLPARVTPDLNGISLAGQWWLNIECWLGSFVIFKESGSVLLKHSSFVIFQGAVPPPPPGASHAPCKMGVICLEHTLSLFWDSTTLENFILN